MIISVDQTTDFVEVISRLEEDNPFACRLISLYQSYKPDLAFVDYWLLMGDMLNYTGAIARSGSVFVLFLTDETDLEEVSSFMRVSGASEILCDGKYKLDLFDMRAHSGVIIRKTEPFEKLDPYARIVQPDIREAYYLIVRCADRNFIPPSFEDFYVDVNHKLRHHSMSMHGVREGHRLAAVAMTVAESDKSAVLGAVACDPDFRKNGYGSAIVKYLTNHMLEHGKTVYLHRAKNANERFYSKLGFTEYGSWCEYSRN